MIRSMTGYGGAKGTVDGLELFVELKSVNNRYLDTNVRLPRNFLFAEEAVKSTVGTYISRGKVDVFITVNSAKADNVIVSVNAPLAQGYVAALHSLAATYGLSNTPSAMDVARFPDVLSVEKKEVDKETITAGLCEVLRQALEEFQTMRTREGTRLRDDILGKVDNIETMVSFIEKRSPETVAEYRQRLEQKMREVLENTELEESRIVLEAAIFADKVAVDEETVRLRSHIAQLCEMLTGASPVGRKLDFLIQEFNREANTIGSKCNDGEIARCVVDLKSEIEKIREQVQNIE